MTEETQSKPAIVITLRNLFTQHVTQFLYHRVVGLLAVSDKTAIKMLFLAFSVFFQSFAIEAFTVLTFNETLESSGSTSFATFVGDLGIPDDNFILCASVKQARFDDVGFCSVAGRDSSEWIRLEFRKFSDAIKLASSWDGKYHILGAIQNPRLDHWYHICLKLDLLSTKVEVAVNGEYLGEVVDQNLTNIPDKLQMKIGQGEHNLQFQGSVTNIQVIKERDVREVSGSPCNQTDIILPWNPKDWKMVGPHFSLVEEYEEVFCGFNDQYNLAIPTLMTLDESYPMCRHKLNHSIIPFQDDACSFREYVAWHKTVTGGSCSYIWTPFSDKLTEGHFLNMNNNKTSLQIWDRSQPNGGRDENFVVINVNSVAMVDVAQTTLGCSSCLLSTRLLLKLDGLCKDSLMGKF